MKENYVVYQEKPCPDCDNGIIYRYRNNGELEDYDCGTCKGSGLIHIPVDLFKALKSPEFEQLLKAMGVKFCKNDYNFLDEALNSGDGVYRP